jgi:hypothetical protein
VVSIKKIKYMRGYLLKSNKLVCLIIISFFLLSCNNSGRSDNTADKKTTKIQKKAIPIIFDTDLGGDFDDVGAMGMLHALADKGEVNILATISCNPSPLVVPSISLINIYFGRPKIPIGSPKSPTRSQDSRELHYHDSLIAHFPSAYKNSDEAPDAVVVYRKVLSQQPDSSVTIVSVGWVTNLRNLLLSKPDSISPLDGKELVAKKVKSWVAMLGGFPEREKEANAVSDTLATQYAIDNWPTPIIFSGYEIGVDVKTGLRLIKEGPVDSPVRMAYAVSIPKRPKNYKYGNGSYDQTSLLVAARGFEPYYSYKTGQFITSDNGSTKWKYDPNGRHKYLVEKMAPDSVAFEIETLMMHRPK